MNVPVAAQSLSALTNLFANPPPYPRNPTHEIREPLVLYIVRVPGSKDVFLTPLKPPTKASIGLEAIQSSLYYLHVVTEEDEELKKSIDEERRKEESQRVNPPIHRKPLPDTPHANYPPSERPLPPPKSYPFFQPGLNGDPNASQLDRYAARGANLRFGVDENKSDKSNKPPSPRRFQRTQIDNPNRLSATSIGSSSMLSESHFDSHTLSYSNPDIRSGSPSRSYPGNDTGRGVQQGHGWDGRPSFETHNQSLKNYQSKPLAVTLIRRDPVSGGQWNVGNILLSESGTSTAPLRPVSIHITTPGYGRFATMPELPRPGTGFSDAESIKEALASGKITGMDTVEDIQPRHTFFRKVEYQQQLINNRPTRLHRRTDSDSSMRTSSPAKHTRQAYSFNSPWQGICTFSNNIDGRSLRCRHTLPSSTFTEENTTANIAELRFNLPWYVVTPNTEPSQDNTTLPISELIGPRPGKETIKRGFKHIKTFSRDLSRDLQNRKSGQDDTLPPPAPPPPPAFQRNPSPQRVLETEMDRLSLKLGREKAGGGFQGTSAKLGKLIIEDEGLKMCDLVVAACMGVWWQHYDGKDE